MERNPVSKPMTFCRGPTGTNLNTDATDDITTDGRVYDKVRDPPGKF